MTCPDITAQLSDYLDRTLDAETRATVETHLRSCATCQALLTDLDRVRTAAHTLGPIAPPAHIWLEIAGRILLDDAPADAATTPHVRTAAGPRPRRGTRAETWQWLGLAAALLLVTAGVSMVAIPDEGPSTGTVASADSNADEPATVETVEDTLRRAEAEYERAIAMLEKVVQDGTQNVSPEALATLQRNVTTIDSAIAESRAALTDNPASQPARTSLFDALRNKVSVLQSTVVLMNEMRQGDAGGAAEVVREKGSL